MHFSRIQHGTTERLSTMYWDGEFVSVATGVRGRKYEYVAYAPATERPTFKLSHGKPVVRIGSQKLRLTPLAKIAPNQTVIMDDWVESRDTYIDGNMVLVASGCSPFGVRQMRHRIIILDHAVEQIRSPCVHNLFGILVLFNEHDVPQYVELADLGLNGESFAVSHHFMIWLEDESGQRMRAYVYNGHLHLENGRSIELRPLSQWNSPRVPIRDCEIMLDSDGVIQTIRGSRMYRHRLAPQYYRVLRAGDHDVLVNRFHIMCILHTDGNARISVHDCLPVLLGQTRRLFEAVEDHLSVEPIKNVESIDGAQCFISVTTRSAYMLPATWDCIYQLPNHLVCVTGATDRNIQILSPSFVDITIPQGVDRDYHIVRIMSSAYQIHDGRVVTAIDLRTRMTPLIIDEEFESFYFSEERPFEIWLNEELHHLVYTTRYWPRLIGPFADRMLINAYPTFEVRSASCVFEDDRMIIVDPYYPRIVVPTLTRDMHTGSSIQIVRGHKAGTFIVFPTSVCTPHIGSVVTNTGHCTKPALRF